MTTPVTLSSSTLVSVDPKKRSAHRGVVPERIVFWDVNNNGKLDAKDVAFEFYAKRWSSGSILRRCAAKCRPTDNGPVIYWRRVSALDRRLYGGRRFTKAVVGARRRRTQAEGIGPVTSGTCYVYGRRSILPLPVSVTFNPALTLSTKLVVAPFRRTVIPKSKTVSPSSCRGVEARLKGRGVTLALGGISVPYWLAQLAKASIIRSQLAPLLVRTVVKETGKDIMHLGVKKSPTVTTKPSKIS